MNGGLSARVVVRRPNGFDLDAEVEVRPGEVLAVLGPNGAGKTTLLRALAGLVPLTGGRIEVAGRVWDDPVAGTWLDVPARATGLVFQDYRLFPHLSVLENVMFAGRARGLPRGRVRAAAGSWLERVGLAEYAGRRPGELSGGQQQRVALARALGADPAMLLMDEPLAALDARTRLDLRGELRRHLASFAGPSVVVTHEPLEALILADRLLVLEDGRVVQQGPPAEVARRPATGYVARLMGLNLYRGRLADAGTATVELDGGGRLAVLPGALPAAGSRVLVVLSPAAVTMHLRRPEGGSARNVWLGTVAGIELLTDRIRVSVDGTPPALVDLTPAAVAELRLEPGDPVWLAAKATETDAYPEPR